MNSSSVLEVINLIGNTSSTKEKQQIIAENIYDDMFRRSIEYALNPEKIYGIITDTSWIAETGDNQFDESVFDLLDQLIKRELTGHSARDAILNKLKTLEPNSAELLVRIIRKDLRGGFGDKLVNKSYKNLIPTYSYMRCSLMDGSKINEFNWTKGIYSQCLDYEWELLADDGKKYKIGEVVKNRLQLNILTFENGKHVFKPITAWFENEIRDDDEWYTISYYNNGEIITTPPLTDNHKLILEDGREIYARDLRSGDLLRLTSITSNISNVAEQP